MIAKTNRIDNAVNGKIIMLLIGLKFEFSIKVCSNQTTRVGWVFWTVSRETDKWKKSPPVVCNISMIKDISRHQQVIVNHERKFVNSSVGCQLSICYQIGRESHPVRWQTLFSTGFVTTGQIPLTPIKWSFKAMASRRLSTVDRLLRWLLKIFILWIWHIFVHLALVYQEWFGKFVYYSVCE